MDDRNSESSKLGTWMHACALGMGALGLYVLLSGPWNWWRAVLALFLFACPVTAIWVALRYGRRDSPFPTTPSSRKES